MKRFACLICALTLAILQPAVAQSVAFDQVRLIDVTTGEVSDPVRVTVRNGFIRAVNGDEEVDQVIDGSGHYLLPGLAEMHAHVPRMETGQQVDDVLMLYLAHGITTIRGMLGEPGHLDLRRDLATGTRTGPRLITSGPSFNGNSVQSPEHAAEMVRTQAEAGYDFLKLHPGLWPEAFAAIVETADALGIDYAGHVSVAVGLQRALDAGQATIDHLDAYAQELVPEDHELHGAEPGFFGVNLAAAMDPDRISHWAERTAAAGVWNVPTQTLIENLATGDLDALINRPAMAWVPRETREQWAARIISMRENYSAGDLERFVEIRRRLIGELHRAGAGILLGADAPQIMNVPGDAIHHELEIYVESGLSPAQALATGTVNVARFLDQPAHGCVVPGCVANLVLLAENPLEEIRNSRSIAGVMRAGQWFDRNTLDQALADIARRAAGADADDSG